MAQLYSDENIRLSLVHKLRDLGQDVLTCAEVDNANKGIEDPEVLAYAIKVERAVLTHNQWDFVRLHRDTPDHFGIVVSTPDQNMDALALRIDDAVRQAEPLKGKLVRINRPVS